MVLGYSCIEHMLDHAIGVHVPGSAIAVADHHNRFNAELEYGNQQTSDHASKGVGNYSPSVLDYLCIAVLQPKCCGEQLCQTCVHAADNGEFFVRVLVG